MVGDCSLSRFEDKVENGLQGEFRRWGHKETLTIAGQVS